MSNPETPDYKQLRAFTHEVTFYMKLFKTYRVNANSQDDAVQKAYESLEGDPMHMAIGDLQESAEVDEIKRI
jgi:lipopolysaccharide/colanic/teichoic acid biosynthesis glycosyltransferase